MGYGAKMAIMRDFWGNCKYLLWDCSGFVVVGWCVGVYYIGARLS